jgi:hypothetical protein
VHGQEEALMSRRRAPPELRRRTWIEGSAWELLVAAACLPFRFRSPLADLGCTARQRRQQRQEAAQLHATRVAYLLPQPGNARRPPVHWLYVRTTRGAHYRIGTDGAIERYGRRVQTLGQGSCSTYRWYTCDLRGVRWLQHLAHGRMAQHAQAAAAAQEPPTPTPPPPLSAPMPSLVQLSLFGAAADGTLGDS